MRTPIAYLEAAKIEEIADQLEAEGYTVTRDPAAHGLPYDLVAAKNGHRIAVEVKALSALGNATRQLRELREQAVHQGFDEFRLVITNPPHETAVEIEGLRERLFQHMVDDLPAALRALPTRTRVTRVGLLDFDSTVITPAAIRVAGTGVVEVEVEEVEGAAAGSRWEMDFPFHFDVTLNHHLAIDTVNRLDVDTSSFPDE